MPSASQLAMAAEVAAEREAIEAKYEKLRLSDPTAPAKKRQLSELGADLHAARRAERGALEEMGMRTGTPQVQED